MLLSNYSVNSLLLILLTIVASIGIILTCTQKKKNKKKESASTPKLLSQTGDKLPGPGKPYDGTASDGSTDCLPHEDPTQVSPKRQYSARQPERHRTIEATSREDETRDDAPSLKDCHMSLTSERATFRERNGKPNPPKAVKISKREQVSFDAAPKPNSWVPSATTPPMVRKQPGEIEKSKHVESYWLYSDRDLKPTPVGTPVKEKE